MSRSSPRKQSKSPKRSGPRALPYTLLEEPLTWHRRLWVTLAIVVPIIGVRKMVSSTLPILLKGWSAEPLWTTVSLTNLVLVTALLWAVLPRPRPGFFRTAKEIGLVIPKSLFWKVGLSFLTVTVVAQASFFAYLDITKGGSVLEARELTSNILVPLSEEVAFRGFAMVLLWQSMRPVKKEHSKPVDWDPVLVALVCSSAIFAASHGWAPKGFPSTSQWFIQQFAIGAVFGCLFWASRSLYVPIAMHMAWNGWVSYLIWASQSGPKL
jgi:membrane protease YdiL (CAAX protease family)